MTDVALAPFVLAMQPTGSQGQNVFVSFIPILLMIGIFYVLVLLPMRRRQKKIQEFQGALKVGDRVITTSGIYGLVTKLETQSVQLQIADKVRIEVARAAIGGYQGQDPVVPADRGGL
jgi:preprotein translocase subunit YajC